MTDRDNAVLAAFEAWLDGPHCRGSRRRFYDVQEREIPLLREAWLRAWAWTLRAERERLRAAVEAEMPQHERYDDQRASANTLRWVLAELEDA